MRNVKWRMALVLPIVLVGADAGSRANSAEQPRPAAEKPPRTDLYGDPLPPGALVRLGSIRLRHSFASVEFAADGKTLLSVGQDKSVRCWDPATGKEARRISLRATGRLLSAIRISRDGKSVASCASETIRVWDATTGEERRHFPIGDGLVYRLALSSDGKVLAAVLHDGSGYTCHLWDVSTGEKLPAPKVNGSLSDLALSPGGKWMGATLSGQGLRVWDTATGKEVRRFSEALQHLAFSPDGKHVAAGIGYDGFKVWDLRTGRECLDVKATSRQHLSALAFSSDGKMLAAGTPEDVRLWEVAAGKHVRTIPARQSANMLVFSPDGKTILSFSAGALHLWDIASGTEIGPRPGHEGAVTSVALSPDGRRISTSSNFDRGLHVWDATSGRLLRRMTAHRAYLRASVFAPDGRTLFSGGGDNVIRCWEPTTGKEQRPFTIESVNPAEDYEQVLALALSSDGERLAAISMGGAYFGSQQIHLWDTATGKRLARRRFLGRGFQARFTPDLRGFAVVARQGVVVQDTANGQEWRKVPGLEEPLAFSPDGQVLAATAYKPNPDPRRGGHAPEEAEAIVLTELATGQRLGRIATVGGFSLLACSPDGRTLATADRENFRLWDVATGRELLRRALPEKHQGPFGSSFATALAFLPSSDRLATGLMDGTVLIWDLAPGSRRAGVDVKDLAAKELERLWSDLAGDDGGKAHRAVWTLAAAPARAVPFLKERLRPVPPLDERHVNQLIADLDSAEFVVRKAAGEKLVEMGEQAEPALRRALAGKPSLEARKRLEALLKDAELAARGPVRSAEVLRTLRAIRALELSGTAEARQVLEWIARGDPAARPSRAANEAMRRLLGRPSRTP